MIYGLYQSAAGMLVNEYRQTVQANNLANADTVGFKPDVAVFAERQPASVSGERDGPSASDLAALSGGLWLGRTYTDFSEGVKVRSENPLDIALDGPGFISVAHDGERQFTRDGRFRMDARGQLVTATEGDPVLGRGGIPVQLNPLGGQPTVGNDGWVEQDGQRVGELELVDFPNYAALRKVGGNRLAGPVDEATPAAPYVQAGYTEASGVQPMTELVEMIESSRAYQMNAQMVSLQDQTIGRLISVIARG